MAQKNLSRNDPPEKITSQFLKIVLRKLFSKKNLSSKFTTVKKIIQGNKFRFKVFFIKESLRINAHQVNGLLGVFKVSCRRKILWRK